MKTIIAILLVLTACSSTGPRIIDRSDHGSAPGWTDITKPNYEEDGKRYFLGYVELNGDASKSAALNMADEKAMSEPMRGLVDQFLDQNQVGEEINHDSSLGQRVISSTRNYRPPMPSLVIAKRYWEVVHTIDNRQTLRAYSLAEIPVTEFEKAKQQYFQRLSQNRELKQILSEVGEKQRERALSSENE